MSIKKLLNSIFNKLGLDEAILYTSSARLIQAIGGMVTILLITNFLSKEEQGFYYTFASVLAIQIFFELGLGGILTQFVAHEKAHLKVINTTIEGQERHISRLASIFQFSMRWYLFLAFAICVVI